MELIRFDAAYHSLYLQCVTGAFIDSQTRASQDACYPGTREFIIDKINNWVFDNKSEEPNVMWIHGFLGSGKSTIAHTISEKYRSEKILAAAFFFPRNEEIEDKKIILTMAYQLGQHYPPLKEEIGRNLENRHVMNQRLELQLNSLLLNPLLTTQAPDNPPPRVFVIDDLDASKNKQDIIEALRRAPVKAQFKCIIFSRDTPPAFLRNQTIDLGNDPYFKQDLRKFYFSKFEDLGVAGWPSEGQIGQLMELTPLQFSYADVVVRFVNHPPHHPEKQLKIVLGEVPLCDSSFSKTKLFPLASIDLIYGDIRRSLDDYPQASLVLEALLCLEAGADKSHTCDFICAFLDLDKARTLEALRRLQSVLVITSEPISYILHPTFVEFFTDRNRSGNYFINKEKIHAQLALCCSRHIPNPADVLQHSERPNIYFQSLEESKHLEEPFGADVNEYSNQEVVILSPASRYALMNLISHCDQAAFTIEELQHLSTTSFERFKSYIKRFEYVTASGFQCYQLNRAEHLAELTAFQIDRDYRLLWELVCTSPLRVCHFDNNHDYHRMKVTQILILFWVYRVSSDFCF